MLAPLHVAGDEAGALQDAHVLRDAVERDRKARGQLADGDLAARERVEDRPPRRIRDGAEDVVQAGG